MPNIQIPNPSGWLSTMMSRLGIARLQDFFLSQTVSPVAIVDSYVSLAATTTGPLLGTPASAGELVAPVANTRLADTGQLPAGTYSIFVLFSHAEAAAAALGMRLRRRNAADAADVWSFRWQSFGGQYLPMQLLGRFTVANNERFVVENVANANAGVTYQACIFAVAN